MIINISVVFRVVGAIFFGYVGLRMGAYLAEGDSGSTAVIFWTAPPVLSTIFGIIAGPLLFLAPLRRFQQWTSQFEPIQLVLGTCGLVAGLAVAALLTPALLTLPGIGGVLAPFIVSAILGALGVAAMLGREEQFAEFLSRYLPLTNKGTGRMPRRIVVDTSAVIDGRMADIVETGFIMGTLVIPRFVLDELRYIADSPDSLRRNRGRRGLDILGRLQKEALVPLEVSETDFEDARDVDGKLIRLAKSMGSCIMTNDFNLNRIAELEGVKVLNVNHLANAVKVVVLPGEEMQVHIIQEGKESGQGVGFLDDGTMIVVEGGRRYLNEQVEVIVTRVLQTVAGRMIFAAPKNS
ncbi:MAG: PIN domain nuclease [Dehalococcoidia bacterium]|nr:MAG: PIN domain nuclease [Dehalococcoidia bacterium]